MRFEDCAWMDVENYLQNDDRVMIVLGSTEQHGYLSLLSDVRIPQALADAASKISGVIVAPSLNFGVAPYFLSFPGTISLQVTTLVSVVHDVIHSLYLNGFRRILVLNGHAGNEAAKQTLAEACNRFEGLKTSWYSWWQSHSVEQIAVEIGMKPAHANWLEAFDFNKVGEIPPGSKDPVEIKGVMGAVQARELLGDGVFGGEYQAGEVVMDAIFQAALKDILYLLEF